MGNQRPMGTIAGTTIESVFRAVLDDAGAAAEDGTWRAGRNCFPPRAISVWRSARRFSEARRAIVCGGHTRVDEQRDPRRLLSESALHWQEGLCTARI